MAPLALLSIAKRFWWVAPIIACGILFALWRGAEREADSYEARWKAEQLAHAVTRASVERLQAAVNADNVEDEARGEAYRQAATDAARAQSRNADAYRETARRIDALRAAIGQGRADCATPDDVREALQ